MIYFCCASSDTQCEVLEMLLTDCKHVMVSYSKTVVVLVLVKSKTIARNLVSCSNYR